MGLFVFLFFFFCLFFFVSFSVRSNVISPHEHPKQYFQEWHCDDILHTH